MKKAILLIAAVFSAQLALTVAADAAGNGSGGGGNPFNCKNKPDQPKCKKK